MKPANPEQAFVISTGAAKDAGLLYINLDMPGFTRTKSGAGFSYHDVEGRLIRDPKTLRRIKNMAIPPAYSHVWISPFENGHIQATGRDAKGRLQYRYHSEWLRLASEGKFSHVLAFGSALPKIRQALDRDLAKKDLPREKVLASLVWFLDCTLIRIGNEEYARGNHHYGLTTMKSRHCTVEGSRVHFHFVGKRGIKQDVNLADRRMARIVKRIQELPGQDLFQYMDAEGHVKSISSSDVNEYLREISGDGFTAKDFRTWAGTVAALDVLIGALELSGRKAKSAVVLAMKEAAAHLRNTPAICRKSYVHPGMIECYLAGSLKEVLEQLPEVDETSAAWYSDAEIAALGVLKGLERQ